MPPEEQTCIYEYEAVCISYFIQKYTSASYQGQDKNKVLQALK